MFGIEGLCPHMWIQGTVTGVGSDGRMSSASCLQPFLCACSLAHPPSAMGECRQAIASTRLLDLSHHSIQNQKEKVKSSSMLVPQIQVSVTVAANRTRIMAAIKLLPRCPHLIWMPGFESQLLHSVSSFLVMQTLGDST